MAKKITDAHITRHDHATAELNAARQGPKSSCQCDHQPDANV